MRRTGLFVIMLAVSVAALFLVIVWYLSSYQGGYGSMTGTMGQMMGNGNVGMIAPMPGYIWASIAGLFVLIVVGIVGFVYYLTYPEIKVAPPQRTTTAVSVQSSPSEAKENWQTIIRTSKPEERKVLEVLAAHNGSYLQKFIVRESGLSRLKTHRIISRFAERGIIVAAKSGNTNEVSLASWLKQDATLTGSKT